MNQILAFVTFIFCCCVLPTAAFSGFWFIDVFFLFCWHDIVYINILTSIIWYIQFIMVKVLDICEYLLLKKSSGTLRLKYKYVCYYGRTIFVESRWWNNEQITRKRQYRKNTRLFLASVAQWFNFASVFFFLMRQFGSTYWSLVARLALRPLVATFSGSWVS